jgi:enamine deaminase RidA (YjgF/YER057c/UK114 family)
MIIKTPVLVASACDNTVVRCISEQIPTMGHYLVLSICETEKLTMRKFTILLIALLLTLSFALQAGSEGRQNLKKEAIENSRLPDFSSIFNWGVKLTNFKELYLFAGIAAQQADFSIVSPGDYVAQTDFILSEFDTFLAENDLDRDDIIRIEFTLVKGIDPEDFGAVLGRFAAYFQDVEVRPAAGTLRYVDALAFPGLVVEYEIWAAR